MRSEIVTIIARCKTGDVELTADFKPVAARIRIGLEAITAEDVEAGLTEISMARKKAAAFKPLTGEDLCRIRKLADACATSHSTSGNLEGVLAAACLMLLDHIDEQASTIQDLKVELRFMYETISDCNAEIRDLSLQIREGSGR